MLLLCILCFVFFFLIRKTGGNIDLTFPFPIEKHIFETHFVNGRTTVKPGWTSKLVEFIWDRLHMACCFSFNRVRWRVHDIIAHGYCSQPACDTKIVVVHHHDSVALEVTLQGYKPNTFHDPDKKRRLLSVDKKPLAEKLKYRSAIAVRNELLDKAMDISDCPEPAHVQGLNATRIIKCKENLDGRTGDAIQSLYDMKDRFVNSIHNIGLDPFHVMLETADQRTWYKRETERTRAIISIDATGVGLRSPNKNKTYIFLYLISAHGEFI